MKVMTAMTPEEFRLGNEIIWDNTLGPKVTTDPEVSEKLANDLRESGITVVKVARKPRSRNKFLLFDIEVIRIKDLDMTFLTHKDAQAWHKAKNRSVRTMMKAPDEAFSPVQTEKEIYTIYWSQAYKLAFRTGKIIHAREDILRQRGVLHGNKFGL